MEDRGSVLSAEDLFAILNPPLKGLGWMIIFQLPTDPENLAGGGGGGLQNN